MKGRNKLSNKNWSSKYQNFLIRNKFQELLHFFQTLIPNIFMRINAKYSTASNMHSSYILSATLDINGDDKLILYT